MSLKYLANSFNEIEIKDEIFICTNSSQTEGINQPSYVIRELKPVDLRLRLSFQGEDLKLQTFGNTKLTWFDESGQSFTQEVHLLKQDEKAEYFFMAVPKDETQPVPVKLRVMTFKPGWVIIFVSF